MTHDDFAATGCKTHKAIPANLVGPVGIVTQQLCAVVAEQILELVARLIAGLEPEVDCPGALAPIWHTR